MNIREYKKSLMIVKDIDSEVISEAYFILKSGAEYEYESKISAEAERIIRECGAYAKKKHRAKSTALRGFFAAVLAVSVAILAIMVIVRIF